MNSIEEMSAFKNVSNQIIPYTIKFAIIIGIVIVLVNITIILYCCIKKNNKFKRVGKNFIYPIGLGILTVLSGLIINFLFHYELDFGRYKHSVPSTYIIVLAIAFCILKNGNNEDH